MLLLHLVVIGEVDVLLHGDEGALGSASTALGAADPLRWCDHPSTVLLDQRHSRVAVFGLSGCGRGADLLVLNNGHGLVGSRAHLLLVGTHFFYLLVGG